MTFTIEYSANKAKTDIQYSLPDYPDLSCPPSVHLPALEQIRDLCEALISKPEIFEPNDPL